MPRAGRLQPPSTRRAIGQAAVLQGPSQQRPGLLAVVRQQTLHVQGFPGGRDALACLVVGRPVRLLLRSPEPVVALACGSELAPIAWF